jgi:hypothetical protein
MNTLGIKSNNNVSFQAKLIPNITVKDGRRLRNISQMFAQKTGNYPKDSLYLSQVSDKNLRNYEAYCLANETLNEHFLNPIHLLNNMDELMQKHCDSVIVQKLVKVFRCLKEETSFDIKTKKINDSMANLKNLLSENLKNANIHRNKPEYAKPYEYMARINRRRITELEEISEKERSKIISFLEKTTGKDPDLQGIAEIYK